MSGGVCLYKPVCGEVRCQALLDREFGGENVLACHYVWVWL
jgi:hypothetical protein